MFSEKYILTYRNNNIKINYFNRNIKKTHNEIYLYRDIG